MSYNTESIKNSVEFLKSENNKHEYQMVKSGKNCYNYCKNQLSNITHGSVTDFFINPLNNFSNYPFGSNDFYIDFAVPKFEYRFHQFLLSFTVTNNTETLCSIMPLPLIIRKISLLKNSNALGNDVLDYDILLFNLNKYKNELKSDELGLLDMGLNNINQLVSIFLNPGASSSATIELPISLARTNWSANSIRNDLVIRIYFKYNIVYQGPPNNQIRLSNVVLATRVREMSNSAKQYLYSQPKLNHLFNKRLLVQYNIPSLTLNNNYSINIAGFNNVAAAALCWISIPDSNITLGTSNDSLVWHLFNYSMDNVFITDGTGKNIINNNVFTQNYNNYLLQNKFKRLYTYFRQLTNSVLNKGELFYLPLGADNADPFLGDFEGGTSFRENDNFKFNFTSKSTLASNCILNILFFVPALLDLHNGNITESYA